MEEGQLRHESGEKASGDAAVTEAHQIVHEEAVRDQQLEKKTEAEAEEGKDKSHEGDDEHREEDGTEARKEELRNNLLHTIRERKKIQFCHGGDPHSLQPDDELRMVEGQREPDELLVQQAKEYRELCMHGPSPTDTLEHAIDRTNKQVGDLTGMSSHLAEQVQAQRSAAVDELHKAHHALAQTNDKFE
eukprot:jgi/Chlat1/152/Chrsp1S03233